MNKILAIISFLFPGFLFAQNTIGLPEILNYKKSDYMAGTQNWDLKQDNNGIIYIANNEGLLTYDGNYWHKYPLPNKTIVRSIHIGKNGNVYVGGQDELGFFSPDKNGALVYQSLVDLIPKNQRAFGDVWDITDYQDQVFFRSSGYIISIRNKTSQLYKAPSEWSYMSMANGNLYAHDYRNGLMIFSNGNWNAVITSPSLSTTDPVTGIFPFLTGQILITTLKNGLFILTGNQLKKIISADLSSIETNRVYASGLTDKNNIVLGTSSGGVFVIDANGNLIQKFAKSEGLQNINVLSILVDNQKNLWLGLDNGIDYITYNSPIKHILPGDRDASGYAARIFQNHLYIGTSAGLYSTPMQNLNDLSFSKGEFSLVQNSNGQVWGLSEINNQLYMGHHEGAFIVKGQSVQPIITGDGYWNFINAKTPTGENKLFGGFYKGLRYFNSSNPGAVIPENTIPKFEESSRYLASDENGHLWVSHPYHGVFRVYPTTSGNYKTELYDTKKGLPQLLNNQVFKIDNKIVAATEKGIYNFNFSKNKFEADDQYQKLLGNQSIRYLKEDFDGNIWFIHEKVIGVIDNSEKSPKVIYLPELNNKMLSGFEYVYPIDASNIFLGGEKGFYHINYNKYKKIANEINIRIGTVKIINQKDSTLFGGYFNAVNQKQVQEKKSIPAIDYNWKNLHFEFSAMTFDNKANIQYAYRLKGYDKEWSEWTEKNEKDYTNLPPGKYDFEVKARNNLGAESSITAYSFQILPPWYRTNWAYGIYSLLFLGLLYLLYARHRKKLYEQREKFEQEQKKQLYLHQLEINKAESELIALRNDKLQSEIDFKNSELATNAMHLVQKGELIAKLKSELNALMKGIDNEKNQAEIKRMIKVLGEDEKMDKDWEHFAQHFDKVHSDFMTVLKKVHPNITPNEMKLCTYLRMNLSTKEIAQLMNITVRGIEISRYRLRKKLGISTETNLFDYLMSLKEN